MVSDGVEFAVRFQKAVGRLVVMLLRKSLPAIKMGFEKEGATHGACCLHVAHDVEHRHNGPHVYHRNKKVDCTKPVEDK